LSFIIIKTVRVYFSSEIVIYKKISMHIYENMV
jgi:hypothetical protein